MSTFPLLADFNSFFKSVLKLFSLKDINLLEFALNVFTEFCEFSEKNNEKFKK